MMVIIFLIVIGALSLLCIGILIFSYIQDKREYDKLKPLCGNYSKPKGGADNDR